MTLAGFPHSGTPGSTPTCGSPRLFAACRALLRLSVPRHPPCALVRLTGSSRCVPEDEVNRSVHRFPEHHALVLSRLSLKTRPTQHPIPTTQVVNCLTTTRIEECFTSGRSTLSLLSARCQAYSRLQKGGDPAAGSPTATLLRLRPSHRARLRRLPPLRVGSPTSGAPDSHGVTGGVYKARERIHRGVADPRLLAIPASCSRVTDCNPNLDQVFAIRSASRPRCALSWPL
jgi:hypothetical protein